MAGFVGRWGLAAVRRTFGRRAFGRLLISQALLAGSLRLLVLQPERCPPPSQPELHHAITAAVGWFAANVEPDGHFLYRYRPTTDTVEPGYNIVRHAGALVALEQAAAAGWGGAVIPAEAAWRFVELNLVDVGGPGSAFVDGTAWADSGAAALSAVAWTMRLQRDPRLQRGLSEPPAALLALGAFLVGQVEPSGAVAAYRDRVSGAVLPVRSRFYTGEVTWALQRLARSLPGRGFEEPASRTLRYLVQDRDRVEGWFPPIADHWAAYAMADDASPPAKTDTAADAHAEVIAGRFAIQARWESQRRIGSELSALTRGRPAVGAALGTLGEGLGQLAISDRAGRAGDAGIESEGENGWAGGLHRQLGCVTGLLVERQVSAEEAGRWPRPERSAGAWVTGGVTQVDDQQHALSALLMQRVLRGDPSVDGTGGG